MRVFFLLVVDLILLAICVGFGDFPGFVVWLVLSFVGFYANRHFSLKQAALLMKAERDERKLQIRTAREVRKRLPPRHQLAASKTVPARKGKARSNADDAGRTFINCPECDAKNNANRQTCWQCKNALRNEPESQADSELALAATQSEPKAKRKPPETDQEWIDRQDRMQRGILRLAGMSVCERCGSMNDFDAARCEHCGRSLSKA